jgi:hypothetical protein
MSDFHCAVNLERYRPRTGYFPNPAHRGKATGRSYSAWRLCFLFTPEPKGRSASSLAKILLAVSGSCDAGRAALLPNLRGRVLLIVNGFIAFLRW